MQGVEVAATLVINYTGDLFAMFPQVRGTTIHVKIVELVEGHVHITSLQRSNHNETHSRSLRSSINVRGMFNPAMGSPEHKNGKGWVR